ARLNTEKKGHSQPDQPARRRRSGLRGRPIRRPAGSGEQAHDLVTDLFGLRAEVEQDPGSDTLVLAHETEQDVLGADVVMAERERLAQGQVEHLLRARGEGDLAGGDLVTMTDDPHDLVAHRLDGDAELSEDTRCEF